MNFPAHTPGQLGAIVRGFRRMRGLTQQQLASRVGLAQKAISIAETHPERMGLGRLFQVLGALDVELLLCDKEPRQRSRADW
ncbi:MAG: helix-turn-helix domain-containing protein [Myxococcaceae bacterium]